MRWKEQRKEPRLDELIGIAATFEELAQGAEGKNKRSISVHLAACASYLRGTVSSIRADLAGRSPPDEWETPYQNLQIYIVVSVQRLVPAVLEALERALSRNSTPSKLHEITVGSDF